MWGEIVSSMGRKLKKHINDIRLEEDAADDRIGKRGDTERGGGGGRSSSGGPLSSPGAVLSVQAVEPPPEFEPEIQELNENSAPFVPRDALAARKTKRALLFDDDESPQSDYGVSSDSQDGA